jgi:hypothetical protein
LEIVAFELFGAILYALFGRQGLQMEPERAKIRAI